MFAFTRSVLAVAVMGALPIYAVAAGQSEAERTQALPLLTQNTSKVYAQELVDWTLGRHPELLALDLHATPPNSVVSVIIASKNPGRVGNKSDPDDLGVIKTGTPFVEINKLGNQNVEVHVPLLDVDRRAIGEVEMTFPYPSGFDKDVLIKAGEKIRDEIGRRILDLDSLVEPLQFDAQIPINTYAQFLVDDLLSRHPEVEIIAIHAMPPKGAAKKYPIVASNIGRIGKPADVGDLEVIATGKPHIGIDAKGARVEVKLPLQDVPGTMVGELVVVFPMRLGYDKAGLYRQAEKIRDELRARLASAEKLYEARPVERVRPLAVEIEDEINKVELGNKQSLPMTKEVVSASALQNAQEGYSEAVKNQAGVAAASSKGSPSDTISIRGINLNPISNYRINGGLAVAGVITVPTEDKERLETLKGANALMFGIASPAGIINLVTKRATDQDVSTLSLYGTSFGQYYGGADIGRRFGEEKEAGIRVNLADTRLENGVRGADGHGKFGSVGADWKVNDRLSFQGDLENYRKDTILQSAVSILAPVNGVVSVPRVPDPRNLLSGPWAIFSGETTNAQGRADFIISDGWKLIGEVGHSSSDRSRFVTRIGKYDPITGNGGTETVSAQDQGFVNKFERTELLGKFVTGPLTHDLTLGISSSERDAFTPRSLSESAI